MAMVAIVREAMVMAPVREVMVAADDVVMGQ